MLKGPFRCLRCKAGNEWITDNRKCLRCKAGPEWIEEEPVAKQKRHKHPSKRH